MTPTIDKETPGGEADLELDVAEPLPRGAGGEGALGECGYLSALQLPRAVGGRIRPRPLLGGHPPHAGRPRPRLHLDSPSATPDSPSSPPTRGRVTPRRRWASRRRGGEGGRGLGLRRAGAGAPRGITEWVSWNPR